jgi:hypothetical protein
LVGAGGPPFALIVSTGSPKPPRRFDFPAARASAVIAEQRAVEASLAGRRLVLDSGGFDNGSAAIRARAGSVARRDRPAPRGPDDQIHRALGCPEKRKVGMKTFLRENPTIAFGLGLPLLLVAVFLLISGIPILLVAPPTYDVLYATEYYDYANGVHISVVNQKVQVVYQGGVLGYQQPRLWRYSPKTGALRQVALTLPPGLAPPQSQNASEPASKITPMDVPDVAGLTVDSSSIAPDGYEFAAGGSRYSGDIFTGLFGASRYGAEPVLKKNGRSIRLPNAGGGVYYGNYAHFIGWVISP